MYNNKYTHIITWTAVSDQGVIHQVKQECWLAVTALSDALLKDKQPWWWYGGLNSLIKPPQRAPSYVVASHKLKPLLAGLQDLIRAVGWMMDRVVWGDREGGQWGFWKSIKPCDMPGILQHMQRAIITPFKQPPVKRLCQSPRYCSQLQVCAYEDKHGKRKWLELMWMF